MNYKLAKKLKDAGFPKSGELFTGATFYPYPESNERVWTEDNEPSKINIQEIVRTPTLSELIEACGDGFKELCRDSKGWCTGGHNQEDGRFIVTSEGKTPKIVVAKLWLKLNEKRTKKVDN